MLTHLQIRDLAIIDAAEIEFRPGLTVLTGETGAGKSIIVDALQLLAGGRAGAEVVRHGAERAEVSGSFDCEDPAGPLARLLREQSIDTADELTIRRVIGGDGRSRAYLNGQSVPLQLLREVGTLLIDIHGQHEFQSLVRPAAQRELLDATGGLDALASEVAGLQRVWLTLLNRALDLESRVRDRDARTELVQFQVREFEALDMKDGELAQLLEERARLANRGRLVEAAQQSIALLYDAEDANAHAITSRALAALKTAGAHDSRLAGIAPMVEDALINLREAARELAHYADTLDLDSQRQTEVERRLAAFEDLARKHRTSTAELPGRLAQLRAELAGLEHADTQLATLRSEQAEALAAWRERAAQLSSRRTTVAKALSKEISARMRTLGMAGGRFQIEVSPLDSPEPAPHGLDRIEFRVTANPGQPLRPLAKVASGGELARLSLAVQVSRAGREGRCMVFDEVDAGVGGAVAEIVGGELRALGDRSQVLCVTHLPQVASQGHHQLRVNKLTDGRITRMQVLALDAEARIEEIARMVGGIDVTDKARAHAREMLGLARRTVRRGAVPVKNK